MNMSYSSVYNTKANRAMYFASHDTVARLKYYRFFEQSSPAGKDVFACIQHEPFTPPGKAFEGSPVVLRFHDGTWTAAGPIYREWFTKTFGLMDPSRSWIRRHRSSRTRCSCCPEGTLNFTFKDIPRWAKDARDHGVTAVLISGWHRGGHDNGYPHYEPDPRLGTYDDLKRGLEACHKMGVRVYFFVNYQPAMIESDWFKKELHRYVEMREDGGYGACGWGMGTLWARMGHPKPMTWLDPSFPAVSRRAAAAVPQARRGRRGRPARRQDVSRPDEFQPALRTRPRHVDLGRRDPADADDLSSEARKINPEFAMSFECNWDRMLEFGNAIWWVGNMSLVRSVFPEMVETRAITSPYDYLGVNNAVRSEPGRAARPAELFPLDRLGAVEGTGRVHPRGQADPGRPERGGLLRRSAGTRADRSWGTSRAYGVEYNVFRSLKTGKRVCILTNSGMEEQSQVIQAFAGNAGGSVRIHVPFAAPRDAALPVKVTVPGERIVFVEELPATGGRQRPPRRRRSSQSKHRRQPCRRGRRDRQRRLRIGRFHGLDGRSELVRRSEHLRRVPGMGREVLRLERREGRGRDRPLEVEAVRAGQRRRAPADRRLEHRVPARTARGTT